MKTLINTFLLFNLSFLLSSYAVFAQANEPGSGNALDFDGVDDYVAIQSSVSLKPMNEITLSCWVYMHSYTQNSNVTNWPASFIHKTSGPTGSWVIGYALGMDTAGHFSFEIDDNNVANYAVWSNVLLPLNEWHHLAGTYNGSEMKLYIDGIFNSSIPRTGAIDNSDYPLYIGNSRNEYANPNWYNYLNATIDEARIWNYARSQTEIREDMCRKLTGSETGLVGYWRLDEGSGNTAFDSSPNNNDGTLY